MLRRAKPLSFLVLVLASSVVAGAEVDSSLDINSRNIGITASIVEAADAGSMDEVQRLLGEGSPVDATGDYAHGATALVRAAFGGRVDIVGTLLEHGAYIDAQDALGNSALHLAAVEGHIEVARLLLAHRANPDLLENRGATALIAASYYGHFEIVELLLANGATVDVALKDGRTALSAAAGNGHRKNVSVLLQHGADPSSEDNNGNKPLHSTHDSEIAQLLLNAGAEIDARNREGIPPLHYAASWGEASLVSFYLQNGADVDSQTDIGGTALMAAAQKGHVSIVEILLEYGADPALQAVNGKRASQFAKREAIQDLLNAASEPNNPPASAQPEALPGSVQIIGADNILEVLKTGKLRPVLEGNGKLVGFDNCVASIRGDFVPGFPAPHTIECRLDSQTQGLKYYQRCDNTELSSDEVAGDIASLLASIERGEPINATSDEQIKAHIGKQVRIRFVDDYCQVFEFLE